MLRPGALIRDLARMLPDELIAGAAQPLGQEDRQGQQLDQNQEIEFRERPSQSVNFRLRPFLSSIQSVAARVNFHKTLASSGSLHYRPFRIA